MYQKRFWGEITVIITIQFDSIFDNIIWHPWGVRSSKWLLIDAFKKLIVTLKQFGNLHIPKWLYVPKSLSRYWHAKARTQEVLRTCKTEIPHLPYSMALLKEKAEKLMLPSPSKSAPGKTQTFSSSQPKVHGSQYASVKYKSASGTH